MTLVTVSAPFQNVAMPALDLRRYLYTLTANEGVREAGDFAVSQRAAGANMSVDVAAGYAFIQGDDVAGQGMYHALNDAAVNVAVTAAHATLPRIDRVGIQVRDAFHGGAANDLQLVVLAGTPTAGATLSNLLGAAAVPSSFLLLANVLVPAASVSVTTANIDTTVRVRIRAAGGNVPACRAYHNVNQLVTTGVPLALALNSERFDSDGMHDNATNNSRITAKTAGVYLVTGGLFFPAYAGGYRALQLRVNGGTIIGHTMQKGDSAGSYGYSLNASALWRFALNDYVEMVAAHDAAANQNAEVGSSYAPELSAVWVAP